MSDQIRFDPQPKQAQFLKSNADIAIFGGAAGGGKTWSLLYKPTYFTGNKEFGGVIFRRTYPQITVEGGLWDESDKVYPFAGATSTKGALRWTFPSGATVVFRSMENEDDYRNFDGSQIPYIGFDQLESFTAKQFWYMMSRNRSTSGVRPIIRASCNPQPGWLADLIQWWWDPDTGYAIPERSGVVRWFVRIGDGIRWFATKDEALKKHPAIPPKSLTFIFSKLDDNQVLMKADPGYLANLMALPLVERERLLGGNWKISVAGNIFKREWWKFVDQPPQGIHNWCRYWDLAATVPKPGKEPDWTAGVKLGEKDGNIYIADCVHFQGSSLTNERTIKATAELDGPAVMVRMEQEGGASGKSLAGEEGHYARNILVGYDFDGVPSSKKKLLRWSPLSAAAEHGRVFLVKGRWNQDFVDELEGCKGEDEKNDQADAASGALEALRVPTGAWSGTDVAASSTGYERPRGEALDAYETPVDATED